MDLSRAEADRSTCGLQREQPFTPEACTAPNSPPTFNPKGCGAYCPPF